MKNEFIELAKKYRYNDKDLLKYNESLENLYTFSSQGKGLIEHIEFNNQDKILYIGNINISQIKFILDKTCDLTYYSEKDINLDLLEYYFNDNNNFKISKSLIDLSEYRFDKILIIGELDKNYKRKIREYKSLLKSSGSLIIAINNIYGLKYILGAENKEFSLSYDELIELIKEMNFENTNIYFPFPDYKVPITIYSREYMNIDEISNDIPAYNYPKCSIRQLKDIYFDFYKHGDLHKAVNSFLLVTNDKSREIFVKYNRNRKEAYAIKTSILKLDGKYIVRKSALSEASKEHIFNIAKSYYRLREENKKIIYLEPKLSDDGNYIDFEYINGKNLSISILEKIKDKKLDIQYIKNIFSDIVSDGISNIDANFDNFIIQDNKIIAIDYEWVSNKILNKKYSYYRALQSFYNKYNNKLCDSLETILKEFDISEENIKEFEAIEKKFQEKVHGDNQEIYLDNYLVDFKYGKDIENLWDKYLELKDNYEDKSLSVEKLMELKRLTENHVINLENIIENLRAENTNIIHLNNTIKHLNKHLSIIYRVYRKIKTIINNKFPRGTKRRRVLSYIKFLLIRPIYLFKQLATKEGRNKILGNINIGEEYLNSGELKFEYFDKPKLSIIIPVYNQINYTYNCLVSILKNTNNLSYEVIIADDVSSDETKNLSRYVKNIVISRNTSNQGFLRNCNQAAKIAKGEYILFLNNDTVVEKDCFLNMIKLYESDNSIGLVGAKFVYPDGRLQEAGGIIWSDGSAWNFGRFDNPNKCQYNYVKDVDYISGACIMLNRKLWKEIGGFDDRFAPAYCEDSDLCFEVRKRGLRVVYQPKSVVIHFEGISNGTDVNGSGLKKYQIENSEKLKNKWEKELKEQFDNNESPEVFRARERSKNKKIILFIDHYVPTFDKDAGSKTTYQYLKMLVKKGYIVKFLGDNFLKDEPYTSILENLGIEVLYGKDMQLDIFDWIKRNAKDIHIAYINRPNIAYKYIDFIQKNTNIKVIYYGHDLHFLRENREYELTNDREYKLNSRYWKNIEMNILRKADISYYPSVVECDYIKNIDKNINVKPITAYVYDKFKKNINRDFTKREGILFVGGFGHPPNKDGLLWFVKNIYPHVSKQLKLNFYIVGSKADDEIKALNNKEKGIVFKGFVSEEELELLYRNVKLVVVPLRFGAGVKGKVIEALYYNVPLITTNVGAEGIKNAENVMEIIDSEKDFANEIVSLYNDNDRLTKMSEKADTYIRKYNSVDAVWDIIKDDFK